MGSQNDQRRSALSTTGSAMTYPTPEMVVSGVPYVVVEVEGRVAFPPGPRRVLHGARRFVERLSRARFGAEP